jgi:uncharacterized protein (TIGR03435 family)
MAYFWNANGHANSSLITPPISGGPAWINSDKFMINAKADGNTPQEIMRGPMLQALIEERFKLKIRHETREVPVYALTVAKNGPKLQRFKEGSCIPIDHTKPDSFKPGRTCVSRTGRNGSNVTFDVRGLSLHDFSAWFGLDRPVIDRTGITGLFDFHLEFAPDQSTPTYLPGGDQNRGFVATPDDPAGGPSIFTAVKEQLGLRLDPAKGPQEFLVIDHVERPSEN